MENVVPMRGDHPKPVPDAPDLMSEGGKKVWSRLAPELVMRDRLLPHYEDFFFTYCEAVNDMIELTSVIVCEGRTYSVKTRNGMQQKKTAAWQARLDVYPVLRQFGAVFGMSPVDDTRLANTSQGDLFDSIMKKINGTD